MILALPWRLRAPLQRRHPGLAKLQPQAVEWRGGDPKTDHSGVVLVDGSLPFSFYLGDTGISPRKEGLATPTATVSGVPAFLSDTSPVRDGSIVLRLSAGFVDPGDSVGLSSNRDALGAVREENGLASQKTAQSVLNLSDRVLMRKFAQYSSDAVDGHRVTPGACTSRRIIESGTSRTSAS